MVHTTLDVHPAAFGGHCHDTSRPTRHSINRICFEPGCDTSVLTAAEKRIHPSSYSLLQAQVQEKGC